MTAPPTKEPRRWLVRLNRRGDLMDCASVETGLRQAGDTVVVPVIEAVAYDALLEEFRRDTVAARGRIETLCNEAVALAAKLQRAESILEAHGEVVASGKPFVVVYQEDYDKWVEGKNALAAKLAQAERERDFVREQNMVLLGNRQDSEAEIARLTRELEVSQTEHERLAKMLHTEQIKLEEAKRARFDDLLKNEYPRISGLAAENAALRAVVEAAKAYADYSDGADQLYADNLGDEPPCTPEWKRVKDALAALEEKK